MDKPADPTFLGLTDPNGMLQNRFQLSNGDAYKGLATADLNQQISQARDQAMKQGQGSTTAARDMLASRGGLSGGAAAQLGRQNMENTMLQNQGVTQAGLNGGNQINMKQFDIGRDAEKTNLGNLIGNQIGQNNFNQNLYGQKMQAWAANNTANAMAKAAPRAKGGIVGGATSGIGSVLGKA